MPDQTLSTPHGPITLEEPTPDLIRFIASRWPMGGLGGELKGERVYGLVFQKGPQEVWGVKLQQVETSEDNARWWMEINSARLALAIPGYLKLSFGGVLVAGVYMRTKGEDFCEPGIALFPAPDVDGKECREKASTPHMEAKLGPGSSNMVMGMVKQIAAVPEDALPPIRLIGLDVRPRLKMDALRLDVLILQQHVVCLRKLVQESDPFWTYAAQAGLQQMLHMPSVPAGTNEDRCSES